MSNPEAKTKAFRKSLKLVVTTTGQVTLYGQDITDALTENNYPLWFRMYSDTLAEYTDKDRDEDQETENEICRDDIDDDETDLYKKFGVKPSDFF